jgi:hypothetical protein
MPGATLHLTHVELLAREPALPAPLRLALERELTYTRLGSVFHDLPFYTNIITMVLGYWLEMPAEHVPFAQKLHRYHPELLAWHFLEQAQAASPLLDRERRLALVGGFFAHIALDLELHPLVNWCARRDVLLHGGHESHHHRLTEKYHSLFFHRELQGADCLGTARFFVEKSVIVEHPPFFRLAIELPVVRWATDLLAGFFHEAAPSMRQFASWLRSFRHFTFCVSLPMARTNSDRLGTEENRRRYYENSDFSFARFWERGYRRSLELLTLAWEAFEAGDFSPVARERFLAAAGIGDLSFPPEVGLPPLPLPELLPATGTDGRQSVSFCAGGSFDGGVQVGPVARSGVNSQSVRMASPSA